MQDDVDPYAERIAEGSPEIYCDACGHHTIEPVHGHFVCSACHMPTNDRWLATIVESSLINFDLNQSMLRGVTE